MKIKFCIALLLLVGCKQQSEKKDLDWHIADRSRFMSENRQAVRILSIDDEGAFRKVEVEGIVTKERTWAYFRKSTKPKVGEIWRVNPVADGKIAWFELSWTPASLEDK